MRVLAHEFGSRLSFSVLVPDLYRGELAQNANEANHKMEQLDWSGALADIAAAAAHAKAAGADSVAVAGVCMGGALSVAALANVAAIDAGATFYGIPGAPMRRVRKPLQGHFGACDALEGFSDVATARSFFAELEAAAVPNELHVYEGVGHAFLNTDPTLRALADIKEPYDEAVVEQAFHRTALFFNRHLPRKD